MLSVYAPVTDGQGEWRPPKPRKLGWKGLNDAKLKREAQVTGTQLSAAGARKT
jgi:hypothetical protein